MAVTTQDIIDNAGPIAALINAADNVNIGELDEVTSWADTDFAHIQKANVDKKILKSNMFTVGAGSKPNFEPSFPAGSVDYIGDGADAEWEMIDSGNRKYPVQKFDDTTEFFWISDFEMPKNDTFTGADNVTFTIKGQAATWITGKKVAFKVYYGVFDEGDDLNVALTDFVASGDLTVTTGGQDAEDVWEFTETLTNLGWTAGKKIAIMLGKPQATADQLSADYYETDLIISIPRT